MIAFGCEDKNRVPIPEERICPVCGRDVEVFLSRGRIIADEACVCGYIFEAEKPVGNVLNREE